MPAPASATVAVGHCVPLKMVCFNEHGSFQRNIFSGSQTFFTKACLKNHFSYEEKSSYSAKPF